MDRSEKATWIQGIAARQSDRDDSRILWSIHATDRLIALPWSRQEIERCLTSAEVIEEYPQGHRALPDCLALGHVRQGLPVHMVVALDLTSERLFIVTVYAPNPVRWKDGFRTRT